jgi:hypothetical protein
MVDNAHGTGWEPSLAGGTWWKYFSDEPCTQCPAGQFWQTAQKSLGSGGIFSYPPTSKDGAVDTTTKEAEAEKYDPVFVATHDYRRRRTDPTTYSVSVKTQVAWCSNCPVGRYSGAGVKTCTNCPDERPLTLQEGTDALSDCIKDCRSIYKAPGTPGGVWNSATETCAVCPLGQTSGSEISDPGQDCPAGK